MKREFKVGDRVACYDFERKLGVVTEVFPEGIAVSTDIDANSFYHRKQCRHLKPKKEKRRIWVNEYEDGFGIASYSSATSAKKNSLRTALRCIRFVEEGEEK